MTEAIAKLLRTALDVEGITQAELARRTGLSTKHINLLCQGRVPVSVAVAIWIEEAMPSLTAETLLTAQAISQVRRVKQERTE